MLNKDYKHGVRQPPGAHHHVGDPGHRLTRNKAVYNKNKARDRDKDGHRLREEVQPPPCGQALVHLVTAEWSSSGLACLGASLGLLGGDLTTYVVHVEVLDRRDDLLESGCREGAGL